MSMRNTDSKSQFNLTKREERMLIKKRKYEAFLNICKANDEDGVTRYAIKKLKTEDGEVASNLLSSNSASQMDVGAGTSANGAGASANGAECASGPSKRPRISEQHNDEHSNSVDKSGQTCMDIADELKIMRAEISRLKRVKNPPAINVTEVGQKAQFQLDGTLEGVPLFVSDLKHLLLIAMLGQLSPRRTRWCTIARWSGLSHVAVVVVEGLSVNDYRRHAAKMKWTNANFELLFEVFPSQQFQTKAIDEILLVVNVMRTNSKLLGSDWSCHQENDKHPDIRAASVVNKELEAFFNIQLKNGSKIAPQSHVAEVKDKFSRTRLLLSPQQMVVEDFPFRIRGLEGEEGYVYTKDEYAQVTPNSPLFGVDCEMCMTLSGENELARISIVNEQLEVIYDKLVKPRNKIVDYLTRFSGISAKMLEYVTTRIEDVQELVRRILPPDAILCGQSLNVDLRAMKMMHPYVIDTSIIYNLTGVSRNKTSLKNLTKLFLKEDIQNKYGHDSIEDSLATLRLVQLKLANSIEFGNVIIQGRNVESGGHDGHSRRLHNEKKVAVLSSVEVSAPDFPTDCATVVVSRMQCSSNKDVGRRMREVVLENDLTIAHMMVSVDDATPSEEERKITKLDKRLRRIYNSCAVNSLFVVLFADSTRKSSVGYHENGICMIQIRPSLT